MLFVIAAFNHGYAEEKNPEQQPGLPYIAFVYDIFGQPEDLEEQLHNPNNYYINDNIFLGEDDSVPAKLRKISLQNTNIQTTIFRGPFSVGVHKISKPSSFLHLFTIHSMLMQFGVERVIFVDEEQEEIKSKSDQYSLRVTPDPIQRQVQIPFNIHVFKFMNTTDHPCLIDDPSTCIFHNRKFEFFRSFSLVSNEAGDLYPKITSLDKIDEDGNSLDKLDMDNFSIDDPKYQAFIFLVKNLETGVYEKIWTMILATDDLIFFPDFEPSTPLPEEKHEPIPGQVYPIVSVSLIN